MQLKHWCLIGIISCRYYEYLLSLVLGDITVSLLHMRRPRFSEVRSHSWDQGLCPQSPQSFHYPRLPRPLLNQEETQARRKWELLFAFRWEVVVVQGQSPSPGWWYSALPPHRPLVVMTAVQVLVPTFRNSVIPGGRGQGWEQVAAVLSNHRPQQLAPVEARDRCPV